MTEAARFKKNKRVSISLTDDSYSEMLSQARSMGFDDVSEYLYMLHHSHMNQERSKSPEENRRRVKVGKYSPQPVFQTGLGCIYRGDSAELMNSVLEEKSVDLIITSPPYGLTKPKDYGNEDSSRYLAWFAPFAEGFKRVLKPQGSLVIDIGGAWKRGSPTRSLYHFELLIDLCRNYGFHLAQEFYWWNPGKLPCPAEWTNVRRVRVKDAVNCIWWLSTTPYPKASNRRVLQPYSESMKYLIENGYKPNRRPSGHNITGKFKVDRGGAIPPNLLALANNESTTDTYLKYCSAKGLTPHPARFPSGIPAFFVKMLTDPGDSVLDPFAGSCVTGEVCERTGRRWLCCEISKEYIEGAKGRFQQQRLSTGPVELDRPKPYEIYPPNALAIDESKVPLVLDGGFKGPDRGKKREGRDSP